MANARSGHSNRRSASLPKVCIAASSGGHLEEALCLRRIRELPHFFLTEKVDGIDERLVGRVYYLPQMRRTDPTAALLFIWGSVKTLGCFIRERPDYVISTGAMATLPAMCLARLFGAKVVYIESQARVSSLSSTGRLARRMACLFFVQWCSLRDEVPGALYRGMLS